MHTIKIKIKGNLSSGDKPFTVPSGEYNEVTFQQIDSRTTAYANNWTDFLALKNAGVKQDIPCTNNHTVGKRADGTPIFSTSISLKDSSSNVSVALIQPGGYANVAVTSANYACKLKNLI